MISLANRIIALCLFFLFSIQIFAGTTGKLSGQVVDVATGEPLIGANIMIDNTGFGASTDLDGFYVIIGLPPGKYSVTANYLSYRDIQVTEVRISVDKTTVLDFEMQSSAIQMEAEVVVAQRPLVRKDLTSTESSISSDMIETMPVENMSEIINLQAGVVENHFRGGRLGEVTYMINGVPMNDSYSGLAAIQVDNNAIQEISIISGTFNAEYGNAMSGVVNVVTKEGGNDFDVNLSVYGGSYVTSHYDIFSNPDITPILNANGTIGGPVPGLGKYLRFFVSGWYFRNSGYIYGKDVFLPTDVTTDWLLVEDPATREFMSHGKIYQFSEEFAADFINDADAVSMNDAERMSVNTKLTFLLSNRDKINYELMYQDRSWHQYEHRFRLNPYGAYDYASNTIINTLSWNHVFGPVTFMDIHFTNLLTTNDQNVYDDPADARYVVKERLQDTGANAFVSGGQQMWNFNRETQYYLVKAELTSQFNNNHQIKFGFEGRLNNLKMHEFEVLPDQEPHYAPITSFQNNIYEVEPIEFSGYFQDKMEFEDLVVNAGLRFDYFDPYSEVPVDFSRPEISEREAAEPTYQFSPRLGLAFPISETGVVHVSYGHFFQIPNYFYLYTNPQFNIDPLQSSVSPPPSSLKNTVGNANLEPQQTTIYELGIQQQLGGIYGVSLTVFFKDIRNLIGTEVFRTLEGIQFARYINRDFAYVRGATLDLERRYAQNFAMNINYTYQIAMGTASDPNNAFLDAQADKETEKQLVPLNWDRRHQINLSLRLGDPKDYVISFIGRYGSGLPYTQASRVIQPLLENGGRKPDEYTLDIFANKRFIWDRTSVSFFVKIYNVFDRLNEVNVFSDTGRASYSTEPLYAGGDRPRGLNTLDDYFIRPDFYSSPRRILVGFEVGF